MANSYLNSILGINNSNDEGVLKKIEKLYNTNFYDEGADKYNPSTVLKNLGIYDTTDNKKTDYLYGINSEDYKLVEEKPSSYQADTKQSNKEQSVLQQLNKPQSNGEQLVSNQPSNAQLSWQIPTAENPIDFFSTAKNVINQRIGALKNKAETNRKMAMREAGEKRNQLLEWNAEQDRIFNANFNNNTTNNVQENTTNNVQENVNVFNPNADENLLGTLDVTTELPKLNTNQIKDIISTYFSKSEVITPADAEGIYNAQQSTGMSALAILGIGALESGYGTSNIAKKKGNIWGWGATNKNSMENAKTFSQMSQGSSEFANAYLKTYYNGYGAKTINSAGTGDNPSGKGYAYNDDGSINSTWATNVSNIMKKFYRKAKESEPVTNTNTTNSSSNSLQNNTNNTNNTNSALSESVGKKIADVSNYNNSAAKGQCVWYVRGRMKQKLGKDTGSLGNGNQMWYNAKESAKLAPTAENIKPNTIASYKTGLSEAGKKYGHVIYIEDVVGDTVYYTEGGSYYYNNGTIGTLKTASKKDILNGSSKFGYGLIGFIDAANY